MNVKQLIAAAIVLSATSAAFADQNYDGSLPSPKTRAQVMEELRQAQADGSATSYGFLGVSNPASAAGKSTQATVASEQPSPAIQGKTRAEVRTELTLAQAQVKATRGQNIK
jgi:hypothetical protein